MASLRAAEPHDADRNRLRLQLRRGILGQRWPSAMVSVALIVAVVGTNLIYGHLNHGPNRIFLRTPLDDALPVVPLFVVPYISLTLLIVASLLLMLAFRVRIFRSAALSMIVV